MNIVELCYISSVVWVTICAIVTAICIIIEYRHNPSIDLGIILAYIGFMIISPVLGPMIIWHYLTHPMYR